MSIYCAADDLKTHFNDINRYRRTVGATLALVLQREGLISELPPGIDQKKYDQLKALNDEADIIASTLTKPEVARKLAQMPDFKSLLECFCKYSTVRPFLDYNNVIYNPKQVKLYNSDLRTFLFGHATNLQIRPLLRKATLSRWEHKKTNWSDLSEDEIIKFINQSAQLICTPLHPKWIRHRSRWMKAFLDEREGVLAQEFELALKSIYLGNKASLGEMFIPVSRQSITRAAEIDPVKTYELWLKFQKMGLN